MLLREIQLLKIKTEHINGYPCPDTLPLIEIGYEKQFTAWNYIYIVNLVVSFHTMLLFFW